MAAADRVTAAAIGTLILILSRGLILRWQVAVRVAEAIARAHIPTMTARRPAHGDTVLHGLNRRLRNAFRDAVQLNSQCGSGNCNDYGPDSPM